MKYMRMCLPLSSFLLICVAATAQDVTFPPSMEGAEAALKESPRHGEFVDVPIPGSDEVVNTWVVYPERPDKAPIVLVIHEIFGMTDWVNSVADNFAEHGFIALAPNMITGMEGNPMSVVRALTEEQIVTRLNAVRDYGLKLPAATDKAGSIGFCWGGSASFIYATAQPELDAAVVCYGSSPDKEALAGVEAPILGVYAENDARVNTTIADAEAELGRLGKAFSYTIYDGAGHGFLRAHEGHEGANGEAMKKAWPNILQFFKEKLEE